MTDTVEEQAASFDAAGAPSRRFAHALGVLRMLMAHAEALAGSTAKLAETTSHETGDKREGTERVASMAGASALAMQAVSKHLAEEATAARAATSPLDQDADFVDFLGRLLGWTQQAAISEALLSLEFARSHHAQLVLSGRGDLVPIALALHRRVLGRERPFIVCDPRRGDTRATVRGPANWRRAKAAFFAAQGGTLCIRSARLPADFEALKALVRAPKSRVQLVVCADEGDAADPFLVVPAPICVPPLEERGPELSRIVTGYTLDALNALEVPHLRFEAADRLWILKHAARSLPEIETAALRLLALRVSKSIIEAAARLGMAPISLTRWVTSRTPLPPAAKPSMVARAGARSASNTAGKDDLG